MRSAVIGVLALALSSGAARASSGLDGIDWWKGDVQAAFDRAKADSRPLFLYWGAVWCPPCNQIKKTVFTRHEFQEKMKLFLPVYLDGDTESAQTWGERLKTSGYPTMIVFSPAGQEVLRLPTGLQLEQFIAILDEALHTMTPMPQVVEQALAASAPSDAALRLLAHYSWGQDETVNLSPAQREETFRKLEAKAPARLAVEKSRLYTLWLDSAIELASEKGPDGSPGFKVSQDAAREADQRLLGMLADPSLTVANLEFLLLRAGDSVELLHPERSPQRTALIVAWERAMNWIENNEELSVDERLTALVPALEFHKLERGKEGLPDAFRDRVRQRVAWADANAKDAFTRQAAMSTAGWLLGQVGLEAEEKALYTDQLGKAVSPHYFMSSLSRLAEKGGDKAEAAEWLRKAYERSEGRATRFQWGTSYIMGLMELVPTDGARIEGESLKVFKEVLGFDDAFAGRNNSRIKRLSKQFATWNAKGSHASEIAALKGALLPACESQSDSADAAAGSESLRTRCTKFFEGLGAS